MPINDHRLMIIIINVPTRMNMPSEQHEEPSAIKHAMYIQYPVVVTHNTKNDTKRVVTAQ